MRRAWLLQWLLLLCLMPFFTYGVVLAQDPPDPTLSDAIISSPADSALISGAVEIRGIATHPTAFAYYELEYANLLTPSIWLPIGGQVGQPVTGEGDDLLGVWDTVGNGISDGLYQIRLSVYLNDETVEPKTYIAANLTLQNVAPTPLPDVSSSGVDTSGDPTSAAPSIDLPPTSTPRPTIATINDPNISNNALASGESSSSINFGRLQTAFCSGAIFSLVLFAVLIGVLTVRARLRPLTRQMMWQIRNEMKDEG